MIDAPAPIIASSSVMDRPSRFLIRGAVLPQEKLASEPALAELQRNFISLRIFTSNPTLYGWFVIELMGDTVPIRAVQNMGYTRVAAQGGKTPGILASENGGDI